MHRQVFCCNTARVSFVAAVLVGTAANFATARADTITQSLSFDLNPVSTSAVLSVLPFDPSAGTLDGVSVTFDATRRSDWALWNLSSQGASLPYTMSLTGTTLTLDGNSFGFTDISTGGTTPVLAPVSNSVLASEVISGRSQFIAGMNPSYPSAFHPASVLTDLTGGFSVLGFTGDLSFSYDPGQFLVSASNAAASPLVDVTGTATVTYTFEPARVPDSPLGWWLAATWLGLFAAAGVCRRTRSAA